jgi:4-amino-4-deoxy-L-arabinose transferase-like glycosyltransferase
MGKSQKKAPSTATNPATKSTAPIPEKNWTWLIGLTLLAFAVRIPFLGHADLWIDEVLFMWDSQLPMSPWQVFAHHYQKFPSIGHLPLGAMFHNAFLHLTGADPSAVQHNPFLQRVPALFWGTISVPVLYTAARRLAGETIGRLTGVLFAVGFFPVFYSREAYYYAPLMFFSCASLCMYTRVAAGPVKRSAHVMWFICLTGAVMTHISGVMLPLAFVLYGLLTLALSYAGRSDSAARLQQRKSAGVMMGIPMLSTLPLIPFILIRMKHPGQQSLGGTPDILIILYDVIGKMFAGISPVAAVLSWVFFVSGLLLAFRREKVLRDCTVIVLLMMVFIIFGAVKTQYSSRYFSVASPGIFLVFACGFYQLSTWLAAGNSTRAVRIAWMLVIAMGLVQVGLFHRLAYQLPAKARNYGGMARWLNENLSPGTAYLLESAYDVRFLGQYHQTPNLVPATPFVHSTAEDVKRLREIHQEFMLEHPESPFVEAARHGTEFKANVPVWTWPHSYYKHRYDLWNYPLQKLVKLGIWPQIHAKGMPDIEYHTTIWYNEPADLPGMAAEAGRKVFFSFGEGWSMAQVAQGIYMRVHQPSRARVNAKNLTGQELTGRLSLTGSVAASQEVAVRVELNGSIIATGKWVPGQLHEIAVPAVTLKSDANELILVTDPSRLSSINAIILRSVEFN